MSTTPQEEPRSTRGTVVAMPPRVAPRKPAPDTKSTAPPARHEPAEPCEEPGYGHGV
jgi:hypothetical protein